MLEKGWGIPVSGSCISRLLGDHRAVVPFHKGSFPDASSSFLGDSPIDAGESSSDVVVLVMHAGMSNGVSALCFKNVLVKAFCFKEIYLMNLFCCVLSFNLVCGSYTFLCLNFEKVTFQGSF